MDVTERIRMVKAMEYVARQMNDESGFESWLMAGVADGDIEYGDLDVRPEDAEELDWYLQDENFAELMALFLLILRRAMKSGGLYCDGVTST